MSEKVAEAILTAVAVEALYKSTLFDKGEDRDGEIVIDGIMTETHFHPSRLEETREAVKRLLAELPDTFKQSVGGGHSFLAACYDRNGRHWGEHVNMEQLFSLGLGLGLVTLPLPRALWSVLPGEMPYYTVVEEA